MSVIMTTATTLGAILFTPLLCKTLLGTTVPVDARGIAISTMQVGGTWRAYETEYRSSTENNMPDLCYWSKFLVVRSSE